MKRLTNADFLKKVDALKKPDYLFLTEYTNYQTPLLVRHLVCNTEYNVRPSNFLAGYNCPKCNLKHLGKLFTKTQEEFENEIKLIGNSEYEVLGKYEGNKINVPLRHKKCGNIWTVSFVNFKKSNRCPNCQSKYSKAVDLIRNTLIENEINFIQEQTFPLCKLTRCLPFDFYFPQENILLEYDGELHDRVWQTKSKLTKDKKLAITKLRDETKEKFALENNFIFIRIRHDEDLPSRIQYLLQTILEVQRLSKS